MGFPCSVQSKRWIILTSWCHFTCNSCVSGEVLNQCSPSSIHGWHVSWTSSFFWKNSITQVLPGSRISPSSFWLYWWYCFTPSFQSLMIALILTLPKFKIGRGADSSKDKSNRPWSSIRILSAWSSVVSLVSTSCKTLGIAVLHFQSFFCVAKKPLLTFFVASFTLTHCCQHVHKPFP